MPPRRVARAASHRASPAASRTLASVPRSQSPLGSASPTPSAPRAGIPAAPCRPPRTRAPRATRSVACANIAQAIRPPPRRRAPSDPAPRSANASDPPSRTHARSPAPPRAMPTPADAVSDAVQSVRPASPRPSPKSPAAAALDNSDHPSPAARVPTRPPPPAKKSPPASAARRDFPRLLLGEKPSSVPPGRSPLAGDSICPAQPRAGESLRLESMSIRIHPWFKIHVAPRVSSIETPATPTTAPTPIQIRDTPRAPPHSPSAPAPSPSSRRRRPTVRVTPPPRYSCP